MNDQKGTFIVLEGTDGSGKGTQFKLLAEQLQADGHDVALFDFPRYSEPSSYFVKQYLNGNYGSGEEVGPYTGSLFYALDRYDTAEAIRQAIQQGKVVLANRFTASNMAHQGTKFRSVEERRGYFIWLDNLEYEMLRIPRPDLNIVLRVDADIAQQLVDRKAKRDYTDKQRDLHEADLDHLRRAVEVYDDLCQLFPKDFTRIDCVRGGQLLSIEDINKLVRTKIGPLLPKPHRRRNHSKPAAAQAAAAAPPSVSSDKIDGSHPHPQPTDNPSIKSPAGRPDKVNPPASHDSNPYVERLPNGSYIITEAGRQWLADAVTSADGPVYATLGKLESLTAAAAMARLSRRGDDMRVTILDEFAEKSSKDDQLIQRVITAYGDDSVQQLVGQHIVVENASNILTKKLEWGRLAAYLEQSTRYIYFDQKDSQGRYKYYVPEELDEATAKDYREIMDTIFDKYSKIVRELTHHVREHSNLPEDQRDAAWKGATRAQACDAARPLLPVATTATVGIFASGQALESLIMRLMADELPEARTTGERILAEARKVIPSFLERADKPERGGAAIAYLANTRQQVRELARQHLPDRHDTSQPQAVELTDFWPRNELELVADMLYEHSNLPLRELRKEVGGWAYERKLEIIKAYIGERLNRRHRPGRAIEKAHYSWDLLCDYGIFRDLQRHRMVDDLAWQELTPRYGYDIPQLVEDAGLTDLFEECFDLSLRLHGLLQQKGYDAQAQYATLLGHKMRWKITYNAREAFHLHELRTSPQGHPGYRKLVQQMHDKLREVHPLLADAMRFVNQDEDPELTRLAAERYTQYKLQQLDGQK